MDLKIHTLARKPTTVTRQLTKSIDFHKNYLCDFHPWVEQGDSAGVVSALEWMGESGRAPLGRKSRNLGRRAPPATAAGAPEIKGLSHETFDDISVWFRPKLGAGSFFKFFLGVAYCLYLEHCFQPT